MKLLLLVELDVGDKKIAETLLGNLRNIKLKPYEWRFNNTKINYKGYDVSKGLIIKAKKENK